MESHCIEFNLLCDYAIGLGPDHHTLSYDIKGPQGYLINIELDRGTVQTNQFTTDFHKTHYPILLAVLLLHCDKLWDAGSREHTYQSMSMFLP